VRIIAGEWRGRALKAPPGDATRPTADRVRETLFSMLVSRIGSFEGLRVADLFAGSGALGLEALSRGAAHATFVEQDNAAVTALRANCEHLNAADKVRIVAGSALKLAKTEPFDLIFADPPCQQGSGTAVVAAVEAATWLAPAGWMSIETARGEPVDPGSFELDAHRDVGRARITLLRSRPTSR
jgi:16S rRNA (guanine966-N2)-methyltransferase